MRNLPQIRLYEGTLRKMVSTLHLITIQTLHPYIKRAFLWIMRVGSDLIREGKSRRQQQVKQRTPLQAAGHVRAV